MKIIAHRGHHAYPENSLAAIKHAIMKGSRYDGVEFDVRTSRDGKFYLLHDMTLGRTTNSHGILSRKHYSQLKNVRLRNNEKLPVFEDALKILDGYKGIVYAELKSSGREIEFIELIKKYDVKNIIVNTFGRSTLKKLKKIEPKLKIHLGAKLPVINMWRASSIKCYSIAIPSFMLTKRTMKLAKKHKIKVLPYMVFSEMMLERCRRLKVDGIFADEHM